MILVKETYIHNRLALNETEQEILKSAYEIIRKIKDANNGEDSYLNGQCYNILTGIEELSNDYSNSYAEEEQ